MQIKWTRRCLVLQNIEALIFISCLLIMNHCLAIDSIELSIQQILIDQSLSQPEVDGIKSNSSSKQSGQLLRQLKLDQLRLSLDLSSTPVKLQFDLTTLDLPQPFKQISTLSMECNDFLFDQKNLQCIQGMLSLKGFIADEITSAQFSFNYDLVNNNVNISINNANVGTGHVSISFVMHDSHWQTNFQIEQVAYRYLSQYLEAYLPKNKNSGVLESLGGSVSFSGQGSGMLYSDSNNETQFNLDNVQAKGQFDNVQYQYGEDLAEKLALKFDLAIHLMKKNNQFAKAKELKKYKVSLTIDALSGELIQNDLYVVLNGKERLRVNLTYEPQAINILLFDLSSKGLFSINSHARLSLNNETTLDSLAAEIKINDLIKFNQAYLNNILSGTDYEELQIEGAITADINKKINDIKLNATFNAFSLAFEESFSLIDLNGNLHWDNSSKKPRDTSASMSKIAWQELTLNQLPLGASEFEFITHNDYLQLIKESDIPIFDGALHINSLEISQIFPETNVLFDINPITDTLKHHSQKKNEGLTLTIDGLIKPVSLSLVSGHFLWPLLDGTLSALIPSTTYNEKQLTVGGAMMLKLFDGVIIIKDLIVDEPLQDYAQLFANIDLNNLNLESLTKTYNFGEIQGRVEGKLSGLELSAWEPVAFDAYVRTPENDKSSHRISQRAIDNLSSLGGASGLLSRSFLRFFETFRYDKIGLSCKLKNNICRMSGVEPKGDSYYIVKGGGIPRIDVMGFQRQVNWKVLTSRLKAIQLANEAVIE